MIIEYIAPLVPNEVMAMIEDAVISGAGSTLLQYRSYTDYIRIIVQLGYSPALFDSSINVLVKLAINKDNRAHDTAKRELIHYFQPYLSGTHATPQQRLNKIIWMLDSANATINELGLEALSKALTRDHFFGSGYSCASFGSHSRDYGYFPTGTQIKEWYQLFIGYICDRITENGVYTKRGKAIFAQHLRELCSHGLLSEVEQAAETITKKTSWFDGWLACNFMLRHDSEKMSSGIRVRVITLRTKLQPVTLEDQIRSCVLSPGFNMLSINYALEPETTDYDTAAARRYIVELGRMLGKDESLFENLIPDLLAFDGKDSPALSDLGRGFAAACFQPLGAWKRMKAAMNLCTNRPSHPYFIDGFVSELCESTPDAAKTVADDIAVCGVMNDYALKLLYSDKSEGSHERLLRYLLDHPSVPWAYGRFPRNKCYQNEQNCIELIDALFKRGDSLGSIARLIQMETPKYGAQNANWHDYKKRLMQHVASLQFDDEKISDSIMEDLGEIIAYAYEPPHSKRELLQVCAKISAIITAIPRRYRLGYGQLLYGIAIADTFLLLDVFLPDEQDVDCEVERAFLCQHTDESVIQKCDATALASWIDQNPTKRLPKIAGMIDMINNMEDGTAGLSSTAKIIIEHEGVTRQALDNLLRHIEPSGWSGNMSDVLNVRKRALAPLTDHENEIVKLWAKDAIEYLEKRIESWEKWELELNQNHIPPFEP